MFLARCRFGVSGQKDAFGLGSILPRAHLYVGLPILKQQLKKFEEMQALAQDLDLARREGTTFSKVCSRIAAAKLPGIQAPSGYWTSGSFCSFGADRPISGCSRVGGQAV